MKWTDIDVDAGIVTIRRTWAGESGGESRAIIERTKTGDVRRVPIPPDVVALVQQARAARPGVWFLEGPDGPLRTHTVRKAWAVAVESSGLPAITPHGARHSGATNMIAAGIPVPVVARILGHRDPALTMRRYIHPDDAAQVDAAAILGALYRGETSIQRVQSAPKVVPITKKTG